MDPKSPGRDNVICCGLQEGEVVVFRWLAKRSRHKHKNDWVDWLAILELGQWRGRLQEHTISSLPEGSDFALQSINFCFGNQEIHSVTSTSPHTNDKFSQVIVLETL